MTLQKMKQLVSAANSNVLLMEEVAEVVSEEPYRVEPAYFTTWFVTDGNGDVWAVQSKVRKVETGGA
jgi:hypothetical protein